ncbi:hypothetical protein [Streptomyces pseudogriseolus]|uniref:hypothetical protein n=1 Tax=Streptomyces pseudogriseolus TaxID=36817 RepID=UPI003FA223B0
MDDYIPFGAAIVLLAFSPLLERRAKKAIMESIRQSDQQTAAGAVVPVHRTDSFIEGYVSFAIDAVQIVPAILLTAIGLTLAVPHDWAPAIGAVALLATVPVIVGVEAYVLGLDPQLYNSKRLAGYSLFAVISAAVNALCIVSIAILT